MPITNVSSWVYTEKNKLEAGTWIHLFELSYTDPYNVPVIYDAPVAYWRLGEAAGVNAYDSSGNNHTGTYVNAPTLVQTGALIGDTNTAALFNGTDEYVNCGNPVDFQLSSGSIEIAVKTADAGSGLRGIFTKENAFSIVFNSNILGVYDYNTSTFRTAIVDITDNLYHHLVFTFQSGVTNGSILYLDGIAVLTTTVTVVNQSSPVTLASTGTSQYANITLDEAAIYNTILSASRVQVHYDSMVTKKVRLAKYSSDVTWNGYTWMAWPISEISFNQSVEGELPTTTIVVAGITSYIMSIVEHYIVEGKRGNIYLVHSNYLTDTNPVRSVPFTVISISCSWEGVQFNVIMAQASFDPFKVQLPLRLVTRTEFPGVLGSRLTI